MSLLGSLPVALVERGGEPKRNGMAGHLFSPDPGYYREASPFRQPRVTRLLLNPPPPGGIVESRIRGRGMNHWKETAEILSRLAELGEAGRRAALATVVHIVGSAYRRPGAKFLIEETGDTLGSVSGGCLEADVREVAKGVLATGRPSLRHYSTGADEDIVWGLGLGCNGLVDVFIETATEGPLAELADIVRQLVSGDSSFVIATVMDGEDLGATAVIAPEGTVQGSLGSADLDRLAVD